MLIIVVLPMDTKSLSRNFLVVKEYPNGPKFLDPLLTQQRKMQNIYFQYLRTSNESLFQKRMFTNMHSWIDSAVWKIIQLIP